MKRISFHFFYTLLLLTFISKQTLGQVSITATNLIYQQDFNTYSGNNINTVPQWGIDGSFSYRGQGNGSSNSGGSWSYGVNGSADRALGYLGSGTSPNIGYSISFVNNTGGPITKLQIAYDFEQWRYENGNTLGWSVNGTGALSGVSLTGLNSNSVSNGSNGIVQITPKSITLSGLNILPNATFGVRWSSSNGPGNDNGIGIDNFRLEVVCIPKSIDVDTVMCAGNSFVLHGISYNTPQIINDAFVTALGCDSVRSYHLSFLPAITYSFADTICANTTYSWASQNYANSGSYNHTFSSNTNCDSIVTLNLFVRPAITKVFADTICANGSYNWASQVFTTSGSYNHTFLSYKNCDSIVTLNLFVRPAITKVFADTICANGSYNWASQVFTTGGSYNHTFLSYKNCDSIVTLNLFVRPAITKVFADTICANGSYNWASQVFTTGGSYNHTFLSYKNCDSVVTLNLFVRPAITKVFADTICANGSYNWASLIFTTSGSYNHTFLSYKNCDSVVTLNLFVRPAITKVFADTICANGSYNWASQVFTTSGSYNHTFLSYKNCDSVVTLNLFVRPAITKVFADTICANGSYNWASQVFTTSGSYNHTFLSYKNCDSVVTLNLFVRPAITKVFADTICANGSYNWASQVFTTGGSYNHTFLSYKNCDSVVTLNLFVRPAITKVFADTICANGSYNWASQVFTTSGSYNHTFLSYKNCDSVVTLNLFVRAVNNVIDSQTICYSMTYPFGGQLLNTTGVYNATFTDVHGCDSNVTLALQVNTAITNTVARNICYGAVLTWGTQTLSASGTYTQTFNAASSCDSIVTLNLTVNPLKTDTLNSVICYGHTFALGTQVLNASGTYTHVFPAANGCDSLVVLHLTVRPLLSDTIKASICHGAVYTLGNQTLSATGYYTAVFTGSAGCDSTVTVNLKVSPPAVITTIDTASCGVVWFEGIAYPASVTLADTFHTSLGCDSVYRFVNINTHSNNPVLKVLDTAGCNVVVFRDISYTESTTLRDTILNVFGCDSIVHITNIKVNHSAAQSIVHEMCDGEKLRYNGQLYTTSGSYPVMFKTRMGCDSLVTLELKVNPLPTIEITTEAIQNYCVGDAVLLQASGAQTYVWIYEGVDTVQNEDHLSTSLFNYKNSFSITGVDDKGCINTASANIEAHPCCNIFMPNAFSPNGDGNNDVFKPVTLGHPNDYVMRIFNRWGQSVFISYNVEKGWDGDINGKQAEVADYYYRISGKCVNGEIINLKGNCTLIR